MTEAWGDKNFSVFKCFRAAYEYFFYPSVDFLPLIRTPSAFGKQTSVLNIELFIRIYLNTRIITLCKTEYFLRICIGEPYDIFLGQFIFFHCSDQKRQRCLKSGYPKRRIIRIFLFLCVGRMI